MFLPYHNAVDCSWRELQSGIAALHMTSMDPGQSDRCCVDPSLATFYLMSKDGEEVWAEFAGGGFC